MTIGCRRVAPHLAAAEDELDRATALTVASHLRDCAACRADAAYHARVRSSLAASASREVATPPDLVPAILAATRREPRRAIPLVPVPPVELARVIQENRDLITGVAGAAVVAAGAGWALWKAARALTRTAPARG